MWLQCRQFLIAARDGNLNEVRRFVEEEEIDPNYEGTIRQKWNTRYPKKESTALQLACRKDRLEVVKYLIEEAKANFEIRSDDGETILHKACCIRGVEFGVVRYLVETVGLSVHAVDNCGRNALHHVCLWYDYQRHNIIPIIQFLVEQHGSKIDAKDHFGTSPLHESFLKSMDHRIVQYMLSRVESVDEKALILALEKSQPWDVKEKVLYKYAVGCSIQGAYESFPVHTIFRHFPLREKEAFAQCIENFPVASLFLLDNQGRLPLHEALSSPSDVVKCPEIVSALARRVPRSPLLRDPISGMFPFQSVTFILATEGDCCDNSERWLDVMYEMLRVDPVTLLYKSTRRGLVVDGTTSSVESVCSV